MTDLSHIRNFSTISHMTYINFRVTDQQQYTCRPHSLQLRLYHCLMKYSLIGSINSFSNGFTRIFIILSVKKTMNRFYS